MTWRRSCADAGPAAKTTASAAASASRRVSMASPCAACASCFEVAAGKDLSHQAADAAEQQRGQVERAGDENDRGAGGDPGVKRDKQAGIARKRAAHGCNQDHQRG